jgi:hypothetical protein
MRQQWSTGRVIAIRAVATPGEAEKWQKEAYVELVWVFKPYVRMTPATRNFLARIHMHVHAKFARMWARAGGDA